MSKPQQPNLEIISWEMVLQAGHSAEKWHPLLPFRHESNPFITENMVEPDAVCMVCHDLYLVNPCQLLPITSFSFTCTEIWSERSCSVTFPEIKVSLTNL